MASAALATALLTGCAPDAAPALVAAGEPAPAAGERLPPAVDHVPTTDPVVFLTYDDGAERDPGLTDLLSSRRLPVTLFLTDTVAGPAYGHLARLRAVGTGLENHTQHHRALRGLPYAGQRAEICGQRTKLTSRFGVTPRLLRPPYGTYDTATRRAAASCGVTSLILWRASTEADGTLGFRRGAPRLQPGDIVAVTDPEATEALLRRIEAAGLRVGRLETYL
ncbi:polysaccharide deacetylase family protein [Streptomyces sp. NPDC003717]|uniref:polysaccharide deacetylase family protein n=1 Tax=Streptomyces sp. NPDC003717 TaxID=3154276 RepID=UPI0033B74029